MSSFIYSSLNSMNAHDAAEFFLWLMCSIFLLSITLRFLNKSIAFVEYSPTLLTSLGILGTFVGIIIGLVHFDTNSLDSSIDSLLAGLKTAFITSVVGIALSLLIRIITRCIKYPQDRSAEAVTPIDTLDALHEINASIQALTKEQRAFTSNTSKTMIGELNQIVESFNEKLNSQFADGLTHFSENLASIDKSLAHFTQAFETINDSTKSIIEINHENVSTMEQVGQNLNALNDKFGDYFGQMNTLFELLDRSNTQLTELNNKALEYSDQSMQVVSLIPDINLNIESFNQNIETLRKTAHETIHESLTSLSENSQALGNHISQVTNAFEQASSIDTHAIQSLLEKGSSAYQLSVNAISQQHAKLHEEMLITLNSVITNSFSKMEVSVDKQQNLIESQLSQEIEQVMASMGQALATISGQFTRDYQLLIDQMQRTVERTEDAA